MGKNRRNLQEIYKCPLPIEISQLPELIPHNPLSWFNFAYRYYKSFNNILQFNCVYEDGIFKVKDMKEMENLWNYGFFGKGKLSRSDASWYIRTNRRLGLNIESNLTNEEITELRRLERKKFKFERSKLQQREISFKQKLNFDELGKIEQEKMLLKNFKVGRLSDLSKNLINETIRDEDKLLINESNELIQLEHLQLMPVEAFFLKLSLNNINILNKGIEIDTQTLFKSQISSDYNPGNKFILDYVVYHHFKSLGWGVRSGIKFGIDFLLYNRGPPFIHAEYSILVVPNYTDPNLKSKNNEFDWIWSSSVSRVIGGVKKTLVFVYVDVPCFDKFDEFVEKGDLLGLLSAYKITEVLYRRWIPSRNRD